MPRLSFPFRHLAIAIQLVAIGLVGCTQSEGGAADAGAGATLPEGEILNHESEEDWGVARHALEWAIEQEIGVLPMGERVAILGATFVGTPYLPGTLELPGPEGLVVRLTAFDCVTLVEHLVVLATLLPEGSDGELESEDVFRRRYREELTRVRYRDGILDGDPGRLHYFSEWISNAEAKGILTDVSRELGGIVDPRPIHFMSAHPESYRQIGEDPANLVAIREIEEGLNSRTRYFIPKDRIAAIENGIRNGDLIASVSTVDGLDIAHTGIAVQRGGRIHLLHAPLVGDSVEVSDLPLAERIQRFSSQSGIVVARFR
jgi:hypothetical protein